MFVASTMPSRDLRAALVHRRHEDWRVGDPLGAPIEEVRRVREDIERRVRTLLDHLGVDVAQ